MSSANISLLGFYQYDNTLFDLMELPEGIDKGLLIDSILQMGGEYEVLYPNPDLLKELIGSWSKRWVPTFIEWYRAYEDLKEVAPLENYDRLEEWSDSMSTSEHDSTSSKTSNSNSSSDSYYSSESMTANENISAFDSPTLQPDRQTNNNNTVNNRQNNVSNGVIDNNTDSNKNGTTYSTHGGHVHGNIGVTTAPQMFNEWVNALEQFGNIYDKIATVFLQNFVIPLL